MMCPKNGNLEPVIILVDADAAYPKLSKSVHACRDCSSPKSARLFETHCTGETAGRPFQVPTAFTNPETVLDSCGDNPSGRYTPRGTPPSRIESRKKNPSPRRSVRARTAPRGSVSVRSTAYSASFPIVCRGGDIMHSFFSCALQCIDAEHACYCDQPCVRVCVSVCLTITRERTDGCRPNSAGVFKGRSSRSG